MKALAILSGIALFSAVFGGFALGGPTLAPAIIVGPYLQKATPTSINIMWETSLPGKSWVEWGEQSYLGKRTNAYSNIRSERILSRYRTKFHRKYFKSEIHHAQLRRLKPDSLYYYRVVTTNVASEVYSFHTPPTEKSNNSFTFVVHGDSRHQVHNYHTIINSGMIGYFQSADLHKKLALVWNVGDIVTMGVDYDQYRKEYFDPVRNLCSQVPFYVAIGNHEYSAGSNAPKRKYNAGAFFKYMGYPGGEHKFSFDYSNTHFVALNTNGPDSYKMASYGGALRSQLTWLERDLKRAAANPHTDFIFVFHHHPYKTELWNEEPAGGGTKVVNRFIRLYRKYGVNVFFYGHTHDMERGNVKEAPLYSILSGGGGATLDNWTGLTTGEFVAFDHPEIQKSIDEHGFHVVEVKAGDAPEFSIKYISLGDLDHGEHKNNLVVDHFTFKKHDRPPVKPVPHYPLSTDRPLAAAVELRASAFVDVDHGDYHHETQWQVTTKSGEYPALRPTTVYPPKRSMPRKPMVAERWVRYQNIFGELKRGGAGNKTTSPGVPVDTQLGDDLCDEAIHNVFKPNRTYYWRVRYRDGLGLKWSKWSKEARFTTRKPARNL